MYDKWLDVLNDVKLFNNIDFNELLNILNCMKPVIRNYKKKENITNAYEQFNGIGIILEGDVIITKDNLAGSRIIMAKLSTGDIFGETIAFSNYDKWAATVVAVTDCTIMFMPPERIIGNCPNLCGGHTELIKNMLSIVSQKALNLNRKLDFLTIKSIRGRFSTYLLELYNKKKTNTIMLPLKRNELADFLNVSRPSLSREMIKMKEEGIIDFYRSTIKILCIDKLKNSI